MHGRQNAKECVHFSPFIAMLLRTISYVPIYLFTSLRSTYRSHHLCGTQSENARGINTIAYIVSLYQKLLSIRYTRYYTSMHLSYFFAFEQLYTVNACSVLILARLLLSSFCGRRIKIAFAKSKQMNWKKDRK